MGVRYVTELDELPGPLSGWWIIFKTQGHSFTEIARCAREQDARFILNALGSPVAGTRIAKTLAKETRFNQ